MFSISILIPSLEKKTKKIVSMWEHWSYCFIIFKKIICNQNAIEVEEN